MNKYSTYKDEDFLDKNSPDSSLSVFAKKLFNGIDYNNLTPQQRRVAYIEWMNICENMEDE